MRDEQAIWRALIDAVQGDEPETLLNLVEEDRPTLEDIRDRLAPEEQRTLQEILEYCARPDPNECQSPRPTETIDWHQASTIQLRGRWAAVLERLFATARAAFWERVEAGVNDEHAREGLRKLVERQKQTGLPRDDQILDALQNREEVRRLTSELQAILSAGRNEPAALFRQWRALVEWGWRQFSVTAPNGARVIDLSREATARKLYATSDSKLSIPLQWATETQAATSALWPLAHAAGFDARGTQPIHILVDDLGTVLDGKAVDIAASSRAVGLIVDELVRRLPSQRRQDEAMHADPEQPNRDGVAPHGKMTTLDVGSGQDPDREELANAVRAFIESQRPEDVKRALLFRTYALPKGERRLRMRNEADDRELSRVLELLVEREPLLRVRKGYYRAP